MAKNSMKPRIRFKGFTDAWEQREFNSIAKRITEMTDTEDLPRVEYEDIVSGQGTLNKDINKKKSCKTGILFDNGDVLFGKLRPYLKNWLFATFMGIAVGDFWVLRANNADGLYIYTLLQIDAFQDIANQSTGTKMPRADWSLVSKQRFLTPTVVPEQRKIGEFFKQLDNLITLHQRKYFCNTLSIQPFSLCGCLSNFTNAWEQRKAKELCSISTGKSNTQDQVDDGLYPFYIRSDIPVRSNKYLYDCEAVITIGDGNIGRVFHYVNGKFDLHQRCYKMTDFNGIWGKYFYFFFSQNFYDRAMSMTAKATVDSVRMEMISEMDIGYPVNLIEQKQIAQFLSNLDNLKRL